MRTQTTSHAIVAAIIGVSAIACHHGSTETVSTLPSAPVPVETQPHAAPTNTAMMCPLQVPGTQVAVSDTRDGVVVVFTTPRENLAQLRERVHEMAQQNEHLMGNDRDLDRSVPPPYPNDKVGPIEPNDQNAGNTVGGVIGPNRPNIPGGSNPSVPPTTPAIPSGAPGDIARSGVPAMPIVPANVRVEEFDDGAQIVITPKDPLQLQSLRDQIRQRVSQMNGGYCPLMA